MCEACRWRRAEGYEARSDDKECYRTWWELQCQIMDYYSEQERERPKLSEQKEFRAVKNAVIQEAEAIRPEAAVFADREGDAAQSEPWSQHRDDTTHPAVMKALARLLHQVSRVFADAPMPRDAASMRPRIDHKRLAQLREKKQAMGHQPDDRSGDDFEMRM